MPNETSSPLEIVEKCTKITGNISKVGKFKDKQKIQISSSLGMVEKCTISGNILRVGKFKQTSKKLKHLGLLESWKNVQK